jgi:hypothetical protein
MIADLGRIRQKRKVRLRWIAGGLFLLALFLRLVELDRLPAGFFHDEAEKAYSAFSVARVGGVFDFTNLHSATLGVSNSNVAVPAFVRLPLFVNVWGSYTSMAYQYSALPFLSARGLEVGAARLPAVLAGALTVLGAFGLALRLTRRTRCAVWTALFLAVSPWHLVFSRWAAQGILVPLFLGLAIWAWFGVFRRDRVCQRRLLVSAVCFPVAFYCYSGAEPFLLAFWVGLAWIWRREMVRHARALVPAALVFLILLIPTLVALLGGSGEGMGRFNRLSVWGMDAPLTIRVLVFLKNYLAHFSPQFLFLSGDANPRHAVEGFGELLWVEAPLLVAGLLRVCKRARNPRARAERLLLGWFLLAPLSAALTNEGIPHALRTLHALPCPQILCALGVLDLGGWVRRRWRGGKWLARGGAIVWGLNASVFLAAFFVLYPVQSAPVFEYGLGQALSAFREKGDTPQGTESSLNRRLYYLPDDQLPFVWELVAFHLRVSPERIREKGMAAFPVTPLSLQAIDPLSLLRKLNPSDAVLVSQPVFDRFYRENLERTQFEIAPFADRPDRIEWPYRQTIEAGINEFLPTVGRILNPETPEGSGCVLVTKK